MFPILNECPICGGEMIATKLECRHCDTQIDGRFKTGPFANLSLEQLDFIELFVRHEGKLTRLQDVLELSYPTIRNRLHEVIRALGYEPGEEDNVLTDEKRKDILEQLAQGDINYDEALRMMESEVK